MVVPLNGSLCVEGMMMKKMKCVHLQTFSFLQWEILDSDCPYELSVCAQTPSQDNWIISEVQSATPQHTGQTLSSVSILVNYTTNCTEVNCDPNALSLHVLNSPIFSPNRTDFSAYDLVETTIPNNVPVSIPLTEERYVVGIRDSGTCVTLHRVQLYFSTCVVPFTPIGADTIVNDIGFSTNDTVACVDNTVATDVTASCSAVGVLNPPAPCECATGFSGANAMTCIGE